MTTARDKDRALANRITRRFGDTVGLVMPDDAHTLRRAELVLSKWAELQCGAADGTAIEQDEATGRWYRYRTDYRGPGTAPRWSVPDRETPALARVAEVCERLGLHYYHQTDPRGCAVYVGAEPLTDQTYSSEGVACCED